MLLSNYRDKPGTKLRTEYATKIMVVRLCAGMVRDGATPTGGEYSVAVVNLETGKTSFESDDLEVVPFE